jgi:AcrR family transcriptional regulator
VTGSTASSSPDRSRRPAEGRERLLDTAERLFAERGITGVSLREITEAAGQRNASVVQYHFGSRGGLVAAIVDRHMSVVDAERSARLDAATSTGRPVDAHAAMRILVEPLGEQLRTESGRHYLQIVQHLVDLPADDERPSPALSTSNPSLARVSAFLSPAIEGLPSVLRHEREQQITSFLLRALADRAAEVTTSPRRPRTSHQVFVANLIDVLVAVLTTPPSADTLAAL